MNREIYRTIEIEIKPSPEELAEVFTNMDGDEQARFFNAIHGFTENWEKPFDMQLAYITASKELTLRGQRTMELIGEYGKEAPNEVS